MNWRNDKPILVPEAHSVASLGVIRSLGRAGYPVHAMAHRADAIGLGSRLAARRVVAPPPASPEFTPWLLEYVKTNAITGVLPVGVLFASRSTFAELAPLMPVARDEAAVYRSLTKYGVFAQLLASDSAAARANLPPTILVDEAAGLPSRARIAEMPAPYFIKVDGVHSATGRPSAVIRADDPDSALARVREASADYARLIVQGFVPGQGAAAAFVIWEGRLVADFLNLCTHEVGGFCTLRESWRHAEIHADALAKIRCLGWEGIGMLEYRWDPATGRFHFIELNPRFWAALHVALYAGCDLPRYLFDGFFGHDVDYANRYDLGVRCRLTFPFEIGYVLSRLRRRDLGWAAKAGAVAEFFWLFADPRVKSDLYFPGDRRPYFVSMARTARDILGL